MRDTEMVAAGTIPPCENHIAEQVGLAGDQAVRRLFLDERQGRARPKAPAPCRAATRAGSRRKASPPVRLLRGVCKFRDRAACHRGRAGPRLTPRSRAGCPACCRSRGRAGRAVAGRSGLLHRVRNARIGPGPHRPSAGRASADPPGIASVQAGRQRPRSISSILSRNWPPASRAWRHANQAACTWPRWSSPVGDGANRVMIIVQPRFAERHTVVSDRDRTVKTPCPAGSKRLAGCGEEFRLS